MNTRQISGFPKSINNPIASIQTPITKCPPMKIILLVRNRTVNPAHIAPKNPEIPMK
jgi:hypothetical protein